MVYHHPPLFNQLFERWKARDEQQALFSGYKVVSYLVFELMSAPLQRSAVQVSLKANKDLARRYGNHLSDLH